MKDGDVAGLSRVAMFKVTIRTDNAAFEEDRATEVARILRRIADRVEGGERNGSATDHNGNAVGEWALR